MSKRNEYIEKMKTQLDELNATMKAIEAKAHTAKEEARAAYKDQLAKLRQQSHAAGTKLDELKAAGEDGWMTMSAEMDKLRDAFKHSFQYFKSQL